MEGTAADTTIAQQPEGVSDPGLEEIFAVQQKAALGSPPGLEDRLAALDSCIALLKANYEALHQAMLADFGHRSRGMSLMYDVTGSISSLRYARKHTARWMQPSRRKTPFPFNLAGARVRVDYQPKGVVGILGTWNFPLFTLFSPLAQVLAAGNRALLKPSDLVPHTASLLCELASHHLDPHYVALVEGDLAVSQHFSTLPLDHLVLTGGTAVGRAVMAAAAGNLTPLTLELGGKSPVILGRSANLGDAVEKIIFNKVVNAGQMCVSTDYVLVPRDQLEAFISACKTSYGSTYKDSPAEAGGIINDRHYRRLQSYLAEAREHSTRIECLAEHSGESSRTMALHLAVSPPADSELGRREVFGPILNVIPYKNIDDAISLINAGEKPLALYYFGSDRKEQRRVLDNTRSGGVTINHIALHPAAEDAPFGGIGASGMGHYHGREGFLEFSHARTVFTHGWFDINKVFGSRPPFGEKLQQQLESGLKR